MKVLIQFCDEQPNFRLSELHSILAMHGSDFTIEYDATAAALGATDTRWMPLAARPLSSTPFLVATVPCEAVARVRPTRAAGRARARRERRAPSSVAGRARGDATGDHRALGVDDARS